MSSSRPTAIRVLRLRVKDKHAKWLCGLAREVNTVFNYCNELSVKVFERERRFLSGFDFWPFLKGVTRGDCALHLPVQAVQEIAEEYARRRRQHQKIQLAWRKSGGARRSLGWIPLKVRTIRYRGGQIYFAGRWLSLWDSYGLSNFELRAGNFSEDSRGRWYLNVCVPRAQRISDERNKPSVRSILDRAVPSLGIDLGLRTFAAFTDKARRQSRPSAFTATWNPPSPVHSVADRATTSTVGQDSIPAIFADSIHRRLAAASSRAPAVGVAGRHL
jgi:putative transposase